MSKMLRCAIYTRKSTEEGLDQAFNSLDAQREACEAYIASQRQEGWRVIRKAYDDGGYSGGNIQRPALQALMADIEAGQIDLVVVYKIDRLTRSLMDFSKMVEVFDRHQTSFVSITQHFNTTSSMGRLTLNVLLSFAQFEREVTGERIRDKIAASKKKGMWIGGNVPLGYDVQDKKLVINKKESELVQHIFETYLTLGCVRQLKAHVDAKGMTGKVRTNRQGKQWGGQTFSRGALYWLLKNPIYRGQIHHQGQHYPGEHDAIIDETLWNSVQDMLSGNRNTLVLHRRQTNVNLLTGMVHMPDGTPLVPARTDKRGKHYRYYVEGYASENATGKLTPSKQGRLQNKTKPVPRSSPSKNTFKKMRVPAHDLEALVEREWLALLQSPETAQRLLRTEDSRRLSTRALETLCQNWAQKSVAEKRDVFLQAGLKAEISTNRVVISAWPEGLLQPKSSSRFWQAPSTSADDSEFEQGQREAPMRRIVPITMQTHRCEKRILLPDATGEDPKLEEVREELLYRIALGRLWAEQLIDGTAVSSKEIAIREGRSESYVYDILRAGSLAPNIVSALVSSVSGERLAILDFTKPIPNDWDTQCALTRHSR